ncbi:MAG: ArsR family transcriptional regulator [archaeon]
MAKKRTRTVNLYITPTTFSSIFKRITGEKQEFDFSGITELRQCLSNEKAKILHAIKEKEPDSIYQLAKLLNRDFKSVNNDVKLLKNFGFLEFKSEFTGKRKKLKPEIAIDSLNVVINF